MSYFQLGERDISSYRFALVNAHQTKYNIPLYYNLSYLSSNEVLEDIYSQMEEIRGTGLFIVGGFDQVASLLANSNIESAILLDINPMAIEYARLRLSLSVLCKSRQEYLSRLLSRNVEEGSDNVTEMVSDLQQIADRRYFDPLMSKENAEILSKNFEISDRILEETALNERFALDMLHSSNSPSDRRFSDFVKYNPSNWLSSDERYDIVRRLYGDGKIKFLWADISGPRTDMNFLGTLSLVYLSNVGELCSGEDFSKNMGTLQTDDSTVWIHTTTNSDGRGFISKSRHHPKLSLFIARSVSRGGHFMIDGEIYDPVP